MGYVRTAGMSTAARRSRRRAAMVIAGLLLALVVALLFSLAYMQGMFGLGQGDEDDAATVTSAAPAPPPELTPDQVVVNVLNGTSTTGLAGRTSSALTTRGFKVDRVDNAEATEGAGVIRHGPEGEAAAQLLLEATGQDLTLVMDDRGGTSVDLVLGSDWQDLPTGAEPSGSDGGDSDADADGSEG